MKTTLKAIILVVCFVTATRLTYKIHGSPKVGVDDANIFFSYAENLAMGNGITYAHNPDRVEGFTSMLWMLICASVFSLGGGESAILVLSVCIVLLTQWILLAAMSRLLSEKNGEAWPYEYFYLILILCSPAYVTWMTITLMDTCLWGLIVVAMIYFVLLPPTSYQKRLLAFIPFALAPMARPEGIVVAPVFACLLWLRFQQSEFRSATKFCIGIGCAIIMSIIALTVFRFLYFGYLLPNTYYAKVSPSLAYNLQEGKNYLCRFVLSGAIVAVCVAVVLSSTASWFGSLIDSIRSRRILDSGFRSSINASTATSIAASTLLFIPVLTGGDHFGMFRFYQPAYPLLCVTLVLLLSEIRTLNSSDVRTLLAWGKRNPATPIAVGLVLTFWLYAYSSNDSWSSIRWRSSMAIEFRFAEEGIVTGEKLNALFAAKGHELPAVGVIVAGGIARTYPGPIVDLMGLNNNFVAHFKGARKGIKNHAAFEKDAFFHLQQDILLASPPVPPETNNFSNTALKGLLEDSRFTAQWRYGILSLHGDQIVEQTAFVNTTFLDSVSDDAGFDFHDTMIWSNKWVGATVIPTQEN